MIGTIIKGVGSFYDVRLEDGTMARCRARGGFRNKKLVPIAGDKVTVEFIENTEPAIVEIHPRKTYLLRPHVANATKSIIVCALVDPPISYIVLDKMIASNMAAGLSVAICFNKIDLASDELKESVLAAYSGCGAKVYLISASLGIGIEEFKKELTGAISVFCGASGAGKSTFISFLCPGLDIKTSEVSRKTRTGVATTRHSELYQTVDGDFILDTPGFSAFDSPIPASELWRYYPEFYEYSDCKYSNCLHINEPDCNVKTAVEEGNIPLIRYQTYVFIHNQAKEQAKP
ncbi:MAG: ribosome small subunit-dependent GTPase A [Eubacteriaceae bacterium]|nr:ribosome small subunit-dependent GTPase A [Eubacteriaceae bacterium]